MSIERTPKGEWRVRYREGNRHRAKLIGPRKADAIAYEQELKRAQRMGTLANLEMGKQTLRQFTEERYWPDHALKRAKKTQTLYAYLLDKHIVPYLGSTPMAQITAGLTESWLASLERNGTGKVAQQKALALLVGILNRAVKWGELAANGATLADKPGYRAEPANPPAPAKVEVARGRLTQGDATLVSVLAYAGLRPQEATALRWADIGERTLQVGPEHKTAHRSVTLLPPLVSDLRHWRMACDGRWQLVFPNTRGQQWTDSGWGNWRRRTWYGTDEKPGAAYGLGIGPPSNLRHTFCSLMMRQGMPLLEQAQQAGHSIKVHLDTYSHLFDELTGTGSAEDAIWEARSVTRIGAKSA